MVMKDFLLVVLKIVVNKKEKEMKIRFLFFLVFLNVLTLPLFSKEKLILINERTEKGLRIENYLYFNSVQQQELISKVNSTIVLPKEQIYVSSKGKTLFSMDFGKSWHEQIETDNQLDHQKFIIYPNPASSSLNFEINYLGNEYLTTLRIYNEIGSKVYDTPINLNNISSIDLSNFTKGLYFIKVQSLDKIYIFVKE